MSVTITRLFASLALVATLSIEPIAAQDVEPFVMVPDHPTGVRVDGCFRATRNLYGPYRLTFCLERRGTYQVRGGGARCDGRLTWRTRGRDILIDLQRASCGNRQAWERATIECRHVGSPLARWAGRVLNVPVLGNLRCTYFPTVRGERNETFTARRV